MGGGDEPEQQLGCGVVKGHESDLVDDDHLVAEDGVDDPPDGVVGEAAVEGFDQVRGGVILDLVPGVDGGGAAGDQGVARATFSAAVIHARLVR